MTVADVEMKKKYPRTNIYLPDDAKDEIKKDIDFINEKYGKSFTLSSFLRACHKIGRKKILKSGEIKS